MSLLADLPDADLFRRCFEDSTDGVLVTDVAGRIVSANRAWLTMHGYQEHEAIGQTTRLIRSEHTSAEVYAQMWAQIRDPAVNRWKGELVNRRKDGSEIPVLLTITPIRSGERLAGYMAIALDQRERRELEELKRLYELTVWHDLRSPLAAMRSTLDLLVMGIPGPLTADQQDLLERARRQTVRMSDLIATTLDLEKLRQRKLQLDLQEVELFALAGSSFQTLAAQAGSGSVKLELRADERPAVESDRLLCRLDPLHAQRCVDNLVKNAIEASPRGGTVRVSIAPRGEHARLSVHNGGPAIPPNVRATLFHPFGTYGKRGGTGLGLYGVKQLAEAMGGTVACETGESGTRFDLELPLAGTAAASRSVG